MDKVYKALADNNRRKILTLLNKREYSVGDLGMHFDISQATLSNHLSVLRKAGLVESKVAGKQRIYRIIRESLGRVTGELEVLAGGRVSGNSFRGRRVNL